MSNGKKIARKQVGDVLVASVCFRGGEGGIEERAVELLQQCAGCVCGQPFALYHNAADEGYDLEVCVPVTRAVETDEVRSRLLEGGVVLFVVHRGPPGTLGEAWEALFDHIERNNIAVDGPGREVYVERPECSAECVTELQVPLE
jgi:effector-binding domain-containing protein